MVFPYVIVDLDHSFGPEQVQALRQADVILLVLRLDFTCLRNAQRTLGHLGELGVSTEQVRVVVNRYGQAKEILATRAEEVLGVKVSHFVPEDAASVNRANNNGVPVVLESPSAKVSRSLAKLAHSVNSRVSRSA
jgi:pilus assembly protein CpaE